jgi:hypothetical protein
LGRSQALAIKGHDMNEPEKIYGWLDSQLSVARFYGGITFQGHSYVIDMNDPKQPLVRKDILESEKPKKRKVKKLTLEDQMDLLKELGL